MSRKYATPAQEYIQAPIRVTTEELAQKYHTRRHIIQRLCTEEGWVEKRKAFQRKVLLDSEKRVMENAVAAGAEKLEGELGDLDEVRQHILRRLLPAEGAMRDASFVSKPTHYASLTTALVAVQKQMCLMRGVAGGEEVQGSLVIKVVPLNGAKPPKEEE